MTAVERLIANVVEPGLHALYGTDHISIERRNATELSGVFRGVPFQLRAVASPAMLDSALLEAVHILGPVQGPGLAGLSGLRHGIRHERVFVENGVAFIRLAVHERDAGPATIKTLLLSVAGEALRGRSFDAHGVLLPAGPVHARAAAGSRRCG